MKRGWQSRFTDILFFQNVGKGGRRLSTHVQQNCGCSTQSCSTSGLAVWIVVECVERAGDALPALLQHVDVLHGRAQVFVAEELLDGANVGAVLEEVRGERVAEGVAGGVLVDPSVVGRTFDGPLDGGVGSVVAAGDVAPRVVGELGGGEDVLPAPFGGGVWILFGQGVGEVDAAYVVGAVFFELDLDLAEMALERVVEAIGEHGGAVLAAFAVAHDDASAAKVQAFDAEAEGFGEAEAAAIKKVGNETVGAG